MALVRTDVSQEYISFFIKMTRIGELGTLLAVIGLQILVTVMMEVIRSSETPILARAIWHNIPEDSILFMCNYVHWFSVMNHFTSQMSMPACITILSVTCIQSASALQYEHCATEPVSGLFCSVTDL
jgi:hypothetical protein